MLGVLLRTLALLLALALPARAESPAVVADIAPVRALVAQVAGAAAGVHLLLPPSADAHSYALRPSDARALSRADLVVMVGPALTPWIETPLARLAPDADVLTLLELPGTTLLPAREAADFAALAQDATTGGADPHADEDEAHPHAHDDSDEHGHDDHAHEHDDEADHDAGGHDHAHAGGIDPHAWLDPGNARLWLDAIAAALARHDPANADRYLANARAAAGQIDAAVVEAKRRLAPLADLPLIVSHDALQYYEHHFGLSVIGTLTPAHGSAASARHLTSLAEAARARGAHCLIALPGHDPGHIDNVLPEGGRVVQADPMGTDLPPGPDLYARLILSMAKRIAACS